MIRRQINTFILAFMVHKPANEMETVGEILELSRFGEYCPPQSLRGYGLFYLITHPQNYAIYSVMEKGEFRIVEPPITPQTVAFRTGHTQEKNG